MLSYQYLLFVLVSLFLLPLFVENSLETRQFLPGSAGMNISAPQRTSSQHSVADHQHEIRRMPSNNFSADPPRHWELETIENFFIKLVDNLYSLFSSTGSDDWLSADPFDDSDQAYLNDLVYVGLVLGNDTSSQVYDHSDPASSLHSLHCYVCNSFYERACDDPFLVNSSLTDSFLQSCTQPIPQGHRRLCRKIIQRVPGDSRVVRYCGYTAQQLPSSSQTASSRTSHDDVSQSRVSSGFLDSTSRSAGSNAVTNSTINKHRYLPESACLNNFDFNKRYTACWCFEDACNKSSSSSSSTLLFFSFFIWLLLFSV